MNYWLIKSEPNTYSWDDLVRLGEDHWDGVRNFMARNNLEAMKKEDLCLFYHSVKEKAIVGIAKVTREYYQDPTTDDNRWSVVNLKPVRPLKRPVTLAEVKADGRISSMQLVTHSRLSVQSVRKEEFNIILEMSER